MLICNGGDSLQKSKQNVTITQQRFHALTIVTNEIFVAYRDKTPECLNCRHVHQQKRGDGCLSLAVAYFAVQNGVCLEDLKQFLLSRCILNKHLMMRKLTMEILLDVLYIFGIARPFYQFLVQIWILIHQKLTTAQVQPGAQSHRRWYTLAASLADLTVIRGHKETPVVQHPYPFSLPSQYHIGRYGLLPIPQSYLSKKFIYCNIVFRWILIFIDITILLKFKC